jgi:hypothetical protein
MSSEFARLRFDRQTTKVANNAFAAAQGDTRPNDYSVVGGAKQAR